MAKQIFIVKQRWKKINFRIEHVREKRFLKKVVFGKLKMFAKHQCYYNKQWLTFVNRTFGMVAQFFYFENSDGQAFLYFLYVRNSTLNVGLLVGVR